MVMLWSIPHRERHFLGGDMAVDRPPYRHAGFEKATVKGQVISGTSSGQAPCQKDTDD